MTLWGDYLITQPKTGDDGNRFVSIFSLATLSDPYRAASVQAIDDRYLRVCDMEGVFWGVLSNADGVLTEVFPREYTNIEYENYGEEEGNLLLERGAEQVRYWIGPHGNFIPA